MDAVKIAYKPHPAVSLSQLHALQGDLKSLSDENYQKLKSEIVDTGFAFAPHCWKDKNGKLWLVDGHQRATALRKMEEEGFKIPKIPIVQVEAKNLKEAKRRVMQGVSQYGHVELAGLKTFLEEAHFDPELVKARFDMPGIDLPDFVGEHFRSSAELERDEREDEIPDVKDPVCVTGQLWKLGNHRLFCGDSTNIQHVEKLMGGEKADITFTSPPYNLGNNAKLRGYNGDGDDSAYNEKTDHKTQEEYLSFLSAWTLLALKVSTTVFCNVQLLAGNKLAIPKYWMAFHDKLIDLMIWDKEHAQPSAAARVLNSVWEFIFILTDEHEPKRSIKTGNTWRGTIDNIYRLNPVGKKDPLAKDHGAVFPVAFAEHFAEHFSEHSVLDLFGGSGSTLIACEKTNRKCFMMEIDPHYCDVIVARWEQYTGKKAELIDGPAPKKKTILRKSKA